MRLIRIVLIALAFAFLSQGKSLPSRIPKEADVFPVAPSESVRLRPEGTTDFTGPGFYARDEQPSNIPLRGIQDGIPNRKDHAFTTSELKTLFAAIKGKQLSKKVKRLLKSRPELLARLNKESKDVSHHKSKDLDASTPSFHGTAEESSNMQHNPEMDDQVIISSTVLKQTGAASERGSEYVDEQVLSVLTQHHNKVKKQPLHIKELSSEEHSETEWSSEEPTRPERGGKGEHSPEDSDSESGATDDMEQDSADDWGSGGTQDTEPETGGKDELSPEDNEWDSGAPDDMESDSAEYDWGSGDTQDTEPETGGKDELSPEDNEWDSGAPDDMESYSAEDDWGSGGIQDTDPETGGKHEDRENYSDARRAVESEFQHVLSSSKIDWDTGAVSEDPESEGLRSRRSQKSFDVTPDSDISANANMVPEHPVDKEKVIVMTEVPPVLRKELGTDKETGSHHEIPKKKDKLMFPSGSLKTDLAGGKNHHYNVNIRLDSNLPNKRGVSTKTEKKTKSRQQSVVSVIVTLFFIGGLLVMLLMASFFVFAWPIRKYYQKLSRQMDNMDVQSGQYDDCELTSIRVDKAYPPQGQPASSYPTCKQEPSQARYQTSVVSQQVTRGSGRSANVPNVQPSQLTSGVQQTKQAEATSEKKEKRTKEEVITDDKKRDSRNVERRRIIKQQTSQRRGTLADDISIAKSVIDGHSKNQKFEKKASERRRVIKHCTSASSDNRRRMSFAEELQTGRSVITPNVDYAKSLERSKDRCREIKDRCTKKRRPSLAEEIGVAKEVIVDSERENKKPSTVAKKVVAARHTDYKSFSDSDVSEMKFKVRDNNTSANYSEPNYDADMEEFKRGFTQFIFDSDEEANWNLI